jgi:hypothetical protein
VSRLFYRGHAETVIRRLADLPKIAEALMAWEGME